MPRTPNVFKDGKTLIDYVLVLNIVKIATDPSARHSFDAYIDYLENCGIKMELDKSDQSENLYFLKLSMPPKTLKFFAQKYDLDLEDKGQVPVSYRLTVPKMYDTELTRNRTNLFVRKNGACTMERIYIMHKLLNEFAPPEGPEGLKNLKAAGAIQTAYPVHDGPCHFDPETPKWKLNDRQLLLKYWACFSLWSRTQPLNLIEKYYGTEISFYFAWLGFYNMMLIPASVAGILCVIINILIFVLQDNELVKDVCGSSTPICKTCEASGKYQKCHFDHLGDYCMHIKITFAFNTGITAGFSVFMSCWACLFLALWNRRENILKIRWKVMNLESHIKLRPEYQKKATQKKISKFTGLEEQYVHPGIIILYKSLTYGFCIFVISFVFLVVLAVMQCGLLLKVEVSENPIPFIGTNINIIVMFLSSLVQVIFIKLLGKLYGPLSIWLTALEIPRTQAEFDRSVTYKRYFLGFVNNYTGLFYIAFIKGKFYLPWNSSMLGMVGDKCTPEGCTFTLCIQLMFLMLMKSMLGNILTLLKPKIYALFRCCRRKKNVVSFTDTTPQHQLEYGLEYSDEYLLTTEFMEMVVQYGFVTFFVAAFPLAPVCALINNTMELRLDALKFVTRHRRPVPKLQPGIGPWKKILESITFISTVTNAFVVAFTGDFVPRLVHRARYEDMDDYVEYHLSEYEYRPGNSCFYNGERYPPNHPQAYELTADYYMLFSLQLIAVIIFEHVVLIIRGIILYFVPQLPDVVFDEIDAEQRVIIREMGENVNKDEGRTIQGNVEIHKRLKKQSI